MRIISDFKDYYDCVQRQVFDKETIYFRKTIEIGKKRRIKYYTLSFDIDYGYVGFCGKIYMFCQVNLQGQPPKYFYSVEKVHEYMEKNLDKENLERYNGINTRYWKYSVPRHKVFKTFIEDKSNLEGNRLRELFIKHNCPIFINDNSGRHLVINPNLSDYNFQTVFDAYRAFQEVFMYVGGVLSGHNKPIPTVSDVDMIEAKGFDKRYSFRKDKSNET